ncbi:MAG: thioredoxin-disulfide reductase [Reyranellaceae bacterium]
MSQTHHTKVLIIGSGPAGFTAAIYAARASLSPIVVQGLQPGGQLTITTDVENYPGFESVIQGPWLMEQMQKQAEHVGARVIMDIIVEVDFSRRPFVAVGDSGDRYTADSVIISTGATARWLGIPSEETYRGGGVSACATCDGFFFRGKEVVVVGGGNTAVEEALYLTNHATKVTLVHRRDSLRAEKILQGRLFANPKIEVVWNSVVEEIVGEGPPPVVTGVRLRDVNSGETRTLSCDGVFVAIGHSPNTELFKGKLRMDEGGYLIVQPGTVNTDIPGVFAAGDVQDKVYRQAVTAAGTGCMAALDAERFLAAHEFAERQAAQ